MCRCQTNILSLTNKGLMFDQTYSGHKTECIHHTDQQYSREFHKLIVYYPEKLIGLRYTAYYIHMVLSSSNFTNQNIQSPEGILLHVCSFNKLNDKKSNLRGLNTVHLCDLFR